MTRTIFAVGISAVLLAGLAAGNAMAQATSQPASQPTSRPHGQMRAIFQQLDLTADQKAQIKAIMQQARTDAQAATDQQAKRKIHQAAREKIRTTVLTADQRTKLAQLVAERRGGANGGGRQMGPLAGLADKLGLSDTQKTQMKTIMDQARKDAQSATDQPSKRRIMKEALDKVKTTVLTPDQQKKLAELQAERRANHKPASQPTT